MKTAVTIRMEPEERRILREYARVNHTSMSQFLVKCALTEVKRHVAKTDLRGLIAPIVADILKNGLPSTVNEPGGEI